MNCPFCAEEIQEAAYICKHCGRDLTIAKPVYEELRLIAKRVTALETRTAAKDAREIEVPAPQAVRPGRLPGVIEWLRTLAELLAPLAALLIAHFVVVIALDTYLWILTAFSILIPFFFALSAQVPSQRSWATDWALALALGVAAVTCMSAVVAAIENAPALFQYAWEKVEAIEFVLSIAFSYIAGVLCRRLFVERKEITAAGLARRLAEIFDRATVGTDAWDARVKTMQTIVSIVSVVIATGASLLTGIHSLLLQMRL